MSPRNALRASTRMGEDGTWNLDLILRFITDHPSMDVSYTVSDFRDSDLQDG